MLFRKAKGTTVATRKQLKRARVAARIGLEKPGFRNPVNKEGSAASNLAKRVDPEDPSLGESGHARLRAAHYRGPRQ